MDCRCCSFELQFKLNKYTAQEIPQWLLTRLFRARIDEDLKNQAADVLAGMGLTISDLVRITLTKVAREKALPFDLREPNQLTIQSIKNSEAGVDVHKAKDADDLFDKLGI